jgi:hypothetical protein
MTKDESSFDRHSSFLYYGLRNPRFPYSLQFFFPQPDEKRTAKEKGAMLPQATAAFA